MVGGDAHCEAIQVASAAVQRHVAIGRLLGGAVT